jgi:hypothetical protein
MRDVFSVGIKTALLTAVVFFAFGSPPVSAQLVDFITTGDAPQAFANEPAFQENAGEPVSIDVRKEFYHSTFEGWSIGYRARTIYNSFTSYEFGMPEYESPTWAPLSRLHFELDSPWHGLQIERKTEKTNLRFEWLTPIGKPIHGNMYDYDWMDPGADFTHLGITKEHWTDGQMIDANLDYKLLDSLGAVPVEFWLIGGFRWQRFGITAYDAVQVKEGGVWPPDPWTYAGDVITFNQQYTTEYIGCELRTMLEWIPSKPLELRVWSDIGAAQGYNVDHHLLREGDRYTMESTSGDTLHYTASAEIQLRKNLSIGAQYDQLFLRTQGHHRFLNEPLGIDETWDNGVRVRSDQSWFTLYLRFRV